MKPKTNLSGIPWLTRIAILFIMLLSGFSSSAADDSASFNPEDIVAKLNAKLSLNQQQVTELSAALTELGKHLDALIAKRESATGDEDPDEFINGVKQAQAEYQDKLKTILSSSQLESYNELREQAIMDMMKNLAEIRLLDIQPKIHFSDDQMQKLIPVVAESMRSFIKIAWEYAGKRLRLPEKIRVARDLKEIQSKAEQQVQKILTPEQYQAWQQLKQQLKKQE